MGVELSAASGLATMFLLGLRHGFDPDHIACIDGFTWRSLERHHGSAPWIGTLFAFGHGLTVTAIAVCIGEVSQTVPAPDELVAAFSWMPTFLLFMVGILNLRQLLRPQQCYRPGGWRLRLIPARLRDHSNPFAIVLIGMLFAAVFDTATQASMWAYVGATGGGAIAALVAGLAFTFGMMVTDTVDGRLLCRIVNRSDGAGPSRRYQRTLGWLIVGLSFGAAFYNVGKALLPNVELGDISYSVLGFSLLFALFLIWLWSCRKVAGTIQ